MKHLLLALPLLIVTPACGALGQDPAPEAEEGSPESAVADTAGTVAATGTTIITGNAGLGALVGAAVSGLVLFGLGKRRKGATPPPPA
jgi:hypothetical protein